MAGPRVIVTEWVERLCMIMFHISILRFPSPIACTTVPVMEWSCVMIASTWKLSLQLVIPGNFGFTGLVKGTAQPEITNHSTLTDAYSGEERDREINTKGRAGMIVRS